MISVAGVDYMTATEAAAFCRVKKGTLRLWVYRGKLASVRLPNGRAVYPVAALIDLEYATRDRTA